MFNVCPRCGEYSEEKAIDPSGPFALCPFCAYHQRFLRLPLFILTGASGTGKTTVALRLMHELRDYVWMESDILWRPEFDRPDEGYSSFRNLWLRLAKNIGQAGKPVVLVGSGVPDQFESCPERRYFSELRYLAFVSDDAELSKRLTARPAWRNSADPEFIDRMLRFNAWLRENAAQTIPPMTLLDTTDSSEDDTARQVATWITATDVRR